jgi:hypothetical protein
MKRTTAFILILSLFSVSMVGCSEKSTTKTETYTVERQPLDPQQQPPTGSLRVEERQLQLQVQPKGESKEIPKAGSNAPLRAGTNEPAKGGQEKSKGESNEKPKSESKQVDPDQVKDDAGKVK